MVGPNDVRKVIVDLIKRYCVKDEEWISAHIYSDTHLSKPFPCTSYYWVNNGERRKILIYNYYHELSDMPTDSVIRDVVPSLKFN